MRVATPTPNPKHLAALLAAVLLSAPAAASAASVWTAVASEKLYPSTPARVQRTAAIAAARNEFEAFQIGVTGAATGVSATVSSFSGPGTVMPTARLYREALINLTQPSSADGRTGRVPDALVPDVDEHANEKRNAFPFDVPAGETRAIWVDAFVPQDATPGTYTATVRVTMGEGVFEVPVTLTVWPFTLPSTSSVRSAFLLGYGGLAATHAQTGDAYGKLRQRYGVMGLDHRITLPKHDDGNATLSHFDTFFGPLLDGTAATQLRGAKLTSVQYLGGTTGYSTWTSHFKARGWFDRLYDYTCDEPPITCAWPDIKTRAARAKAADPAFRTLVTTNITESDANGVTSSIDLLIPVVNHMNDRPGWKYAGDQRPKYDAFLAQPRKELWLYQSCMSHSCGGTVAIGDPSMSAQYYTGWPSYMIDASAVRNRSMQWFLFRFRATGELYFETTMAFSHDPWNNQWDFTGNGDGTLFYPGTPAKIGGTTHVPVASIRLKMIREGMEDYEYLKLLSDLGDAALADQVAAELFPVPYATEKAPEALMAARARIAARIAELASPSTPSDPIAGDPVETPADPADPAVDPVPSDPIATPTPVEPTTPGAPSDPSEPTPSTPADPPVDSSPELPTLEAAATGGGCSAGGSAGMAALLGIAFALRLLRRRG